jgi:hypothetical protein
MIVLLVVVAGVAAIAGLVAVFARQRTGPRADLGEVSSQWISEHRLGPNRDSGR